MLENILYYIWNDAYCRFFLVVKIIQIIIEASFALFIIHAIVLAFHSFAYNHVFNSPSPGQSYDNHCKNKVILNNMG